MKGATVQVIATAGHVDHGKSTLVRALTGMEPDRWAQERARGMTIDLGYAWTTLPQGPTVAFVDVPGHERFIGNMLAGLGPAPAVLMVVAADEGWREQSSEHLAAVDALGLTHGLLVITRSDLADPAAATVAGLQRIRETSLGDVLSVSVSGRTGYGLPLLQAALARLVDDLPAPRTDGRVRLWIDRSFSIRGSGTVVTGTLAAGSLRLGDVLDVNGSRVRVRGLQSLGRAEDRVAATSRVAVNLRGVSQQEVRRGTPLLTPDSWRRTTAVDARTSNDARDLPAEAVLHLGSGAFPVRVRPLGNRTVRLTFGTSLPLEPGDRGILRNPGKGRLEGGIEVLDVEPPPLRRRGAAASRGDELAAAPGLPQLQDHVRRRGAVRVPELLRAGVPVTAHPQVRREGEWLVSRDHWAKWTTRLTAVLIDHDRAQPLEPGLTLGAAGRLTGIPDSALLLLVAAEAGLEVSDGRVRRPGAVPQLGAAEAGVRTIEFLLRAQPYRAPERGELDRLRLGRAELAAAERAGRLLRLTDDVVLLPDAPALALELLRQLTVPFSTSQARAALGTTRRVAVPLLEYLDRSGRTRQVQPGARIILTASS